MSAILRNSIEDTVIQEIECHKTWHGKMIGLDAEKLIRDHKVPYLYFLRAGEISEKGNAFNYYVTFLLSDLSVRHQPFVITLTSEGWYYEQGGTGGPYIDASIDDVLYEIMHCQRGECTPLQK